MSKVSNVIIIGSITDNSKTIANKDSIWLLFDNFIVTPNTTNSTILDTMGRYISNRISGLIGNTLRNSEDDIPTKVGKRTKQI